MIQTNKIFLILLIVFLFSCQNQNTNDYAPSSYSDKPTSPTPQTRVEVKELTNEKVEKVVADLLSDWRLGGSVSVKGIREIPQQNAAVADLKFNNFQYGTTYEGGLVRAKDFKPKPMPQGIDRMPAMDEMFPQRKIAYSKDGKASLLRYNDGSWVLKEVCWGFDTGVKGSVSIR